MKTITFENEDQWLDSRRGRVTGTRLKDLVVKRGTEKKKGFYEIIAERVAIPRDAHENVMDRGHTLEAEALERFAQETQKKVSGELVIWTRDDNPNIAISPDGWVARKGKVTEAIEIKCLNSASHIEAYLTGEVPSEYIYQTRQYFCVNDDLKTLYMVFYDPTMPIDFFFLTIERAEIAEEINWLLQLQRTELDEIEKIIKSLTF
jgi:predicted phage-related endonuclease